MLTHDRPETFDMKMNGSAERFEGTPISPSELLELAEFSTPSTFPTGAYRRHEADNLAEWCDNNRSLAEHASLLARGRGSRPEVIAVLDELAMRGPARHRLAATA